MPTELLSGRSDVTAHGRPRRWLASFRVTALLACVLPLGCAREPLSGSDEQVVTPATGSQLASSAAAVSEQTGIPTFELDPSWPTPLVGDQPDLTRSATSIAVDPRDHVWILQGPKLEERAAELTEGRHVPRVFEFDAAGTFLGGWGGPETTDSWMEAPSADRPYPSGTPAEHGMFVDHDNNVWVTGNGHVALKFSPQGQLLLQIGERGRTNGSNAPALLGNPCELTVDPATNEVYIADGYINRRVAVFDSRTGEYRRHWGAYGNRPVDFRLLDSGLYADRAELYVPGGGAAAAVPGGPLRSRG